KPMTKSAAVQKSKLLKKDKATRTVPATDIKKPGSRRFSASRGCIARSAAPLFLLMIASIGRRGNIWRSIHGRGTGVAGCPQSAVHDRLWKRKSNRAGRIDRPAGTDRGQKEGFRMQYLAMLTMLID